MDNPMSPEQLARDQGWAAKICWENDAPKRAAEARLAANPSDWWNGYDECEERGRRFAAWANGIGWAELRKGARRLEYGDSISQHEYHGQPVHIGYYSGGMRLSVNLPWPGGGMITTSISEACDGPEHPWPQPWARHLAWKHPEKMDDVERRRARALWWKREEIEAPIRRAEEERVSAAMADRSVVPF